MVKRVKNGPLTRPHRTKMKTDNERRLRKNLLGILLLLPYIALLWLPFYNRQYPDLFGFPFFYWYQLLWVPLTSLLYISFIGKGKRNEGGCLRPSGDCGVYRLLCLGDRAWLYCVPLESGRSAASA